MEEHIPEIRLTGVWSCSSQAPPPLEASSRGRKSILFWRARSFATQVTTTSMDLCIMLLTFSSILSRARLAIFSMSRRIVTFAEASGMSTVLMQVFIRFMIPMAGRRPIRYDRSGSFLAVSWPAAMSFSLDVLLAQRGRLAENSKLTSPMLSQDRSLPYLLVRDAAERKHLLVSHCLR